ncbi:Lipoprotein OS=Streptomyces griseomycini OX=66895 GN=FHS37_006655 PE=4 SV=1 [Streptomyces griseomycini]|nr:hypothetical protein GCM10015536_69290 [Streptomyces griseomycini]
MWGKAAGALVLAAVVSGCSDSSDSADKGATKPAAKAVTVGEATATFQAAVTKFDTDGGCLEQEPGTCWEQMQALMKPARDLRKAANADKSTGPEFWSEAYALIDTMEDGIAVGEDKGFPAGGDALTNRDEVLGSAHDLSDWLAAHPVQ